MAYVKPNTFVDGTTLTAAAAEGNFEALRVYLHEGISATDFESSTWIQRRHIQPPDFEPFSGVQHGVSGHQGGQWAGSANIRMTFATKFLTGNGQPDATTFHHIPNTSFTLDIRRSGTLIFHYWFELECGNDNSTASYQVAEASRAVFVAPWISQLSTAYTAYRQYAQETRNQNYPIVNAYPNGVSETFVQGGGYGAKQGTIIRSTSLGTRLSFGLAAHSRVDRVGVVNWGVAVEVFYL
jgi:hypothetical protein